MASALEESALRGLAAWRDPEGVLSLYVNAEPERHRRRQPPFARAARDAIDRLVEGVREPSASRRLRQRIEALAPELDELLALGEHGSGRALFSRVGSGVTRTFALQHLLPDAAWLRQQPVLQPLLRAAQDGRAAGIVSVSRHGLRLVDWRFGVADELGRVDFGDPGDEWQKLPPGERGAHTPNAGPQRDLFHRRALHEAERALAEAGGAVGHTAQSGAGATSS
jgi:Bacterial archaeo-eukaryotic release factor family 10